ncbi:HipA domain-containing protein [Adlercreutzia sp. ZJ141]|uniref:HipA domain-containing protein n=1 Tax=Adlercreutzia sp. ZJ141 TaxID=2709406 RepID=UPI0013EA1E7E|nr:HipA domain-containing protein [Adlercreutzia sp. ZJ141]
MNGEKFRALEVRIAGNPAGELFMNNEGLFSFTYRPDYAGPDLSICFPSSQRKHEGKGVFAWFENLLPDDERIRRGMASKAGVDTAVFFLLAHFGLDLPGAVQVISPEAQARTFQESSYSQLTPNQIEERLHRIAEAEEANRAWSWTAESEHWSLGGMQTKLALREFNGNWFECLGSAASNVIVKPGITRLKSQAVDECVTMRLAKYCGLPVAETRIVHFGEQEAIAVKRYDRFTLPKSGEVVRIHQEDLCQATGTVSSKKYAMDGGPTSADVVSLLKTAGDKSLERFIDALLFNYLTASTDAHAKNYSVLHPDGSHFTLAPLYDVASMAPYMEPNRTYRTAMSIGGENRIGWLRKSSLERFATLHQLDANTLVQRTEQLAETIKDNIEHAVNDFEDEACIDELASRLIPRITALCSATQHNVTLSGKRFQPIDIAR